MHASPVCTVGFDIADQLLPGQDPIGKEIRVDTSECTVIGVGEKLGSVLGISRDNWVILPITTFQKMYSSNDSITLWGKGVGVAGLEPSMDEVRQVLRGRRHVPFSAHDDFAIGTNASYLSVWSSISGSFFGVTIVISSISLIVGGIVIMNIMLVSVTERTREIGLRKSLGARQSDIRLQFLIESSTIACLGGAIGVTLGPASGANHQLDHGIAECSRALVGRCGHDCFDQRGTFLRSLSGIAGGAARSGCGVAFRVVLRPAK